MVQLRYAIALLRRNMFGRHWDSVPKGFDSHTISQRSIPAMFSSRPVRALRITFQIGDVRKRACNHRPASVSLTGASERTDALDTTRFNTL